MELPLLRARHPGRELLEGWRRRTLSLYSPPSQPSVCDNGNAFPLSITARSKERSYDMDLLSSSRRCNTADCCNPRSGKTTGTR